MIVNYLKTSVRALLSNRLFSLINVLGLSIGLAGTIVIGLFVLDELSYDKHYEDASQIYRVSRDFYPQNLYLAANAPQVAPLLVEDFSEIEHAARFFGGQALLSRGEVAFYESDIRFVDPAFFDIFSFHWLAGDPGRALASPFTIVLTASFEI
jgi:putative ABC transport system permease protein